MTEKIKPIKGYCGGLVGKEGFFGRKKEFQALKELLDYNKSVLIPGPRRWGKSSFARRFIDIHKNKLLIPYIILQDCRSLAGFRDKITNSLYSRDKKKYLWDKTKLQTGKIIKKGRETIKKFPGVEINPPKEEPEETLSGMDPLLQKAAENKVTIAFDEFADFLLNLEKKESLENIRLLLAWLRKQRDENGLQMIITSSINILRTIQRMGVDDLITNLELFSLPTLEEKETIRLFKGLLLFHGIKVAKGANPFILEKVGSGVHIQIQLFADTVQTLAPRPSNELLNAHDLQSFYEKSIQKDNLNLSQLHSRITSKDYFDKKDEKTALKILAHLSHEALSLEDLFPRLRNTESDRLKIKALLNRLVDEGYLMEAKKNYRFISAFLKDWWYHKYSHEIQ